MTTNPIFVPPMLPFVLPAFGGVAGIATLLVIEAEVAKVLSVVDTEIGTLKAQQTGYTADADIPEASFGQGTESAKLAKEHTRAHQVIIDSLEKMQIELADYQTAVQLAKKAILEVDEQAEADLLKLVTRTDDVGVIVPSQDSTGNGGQL